VSRGLFADCKRRAETECSAVSDQDAAAGCRVAVEDRCLVVQIRHKSPPRMAAQCGFADHRAGTFCQILSTRAVLK